MIRIALYLATVAAASVLFGLMSYAGSYAVYAGRSEVIVGLAVHVGFCVLLLSVRDMLRIIGRLF